MYLAIRFPSLRSAAALVVAMLSAVPALAQNNEEGLFISVPNPLNSDAVTRIKNQISARRNTEGRAVRKIILDFTPEEKPSFNADFGPCSDLSRVIRELTGTTTVAFVHGKVTGHTVLPVLACKELVMAPGASIGEIAAEGVRPLDEPEKSAYRFYFTQFHSESLFPIVEKMYDRQVQLWRAIKPDDRTTLYFDKRKEAELRKTLGQLAGPQKVEFAQDDQLGLFDARQARQLGLSNRTLEKGTRQEVGEVYGLSAASLRDDILGGRPPEAFQYTLKGDVDSSMRSAVSRVLKEVKRKKGNMLFLTINCSGGDLVAARELADDLIAAQQGDDAILIVGFIPEAAPDAATFIALGCSDIVMSKSKEPGDGLEAEIGDFEEVIRTGKHEAYRTSLRQLAEQQGYPGLLIDGMFDKDLVILRVRGENDTTQRKLMSETEFTQANRDFDDAMRAGTADGKIRWQVEKTIKNKGKLLKLDATHAAEYGLARFTVETRDPAKVYALYGVDGAKVREATPGWLDRFAEFIQQPVVTVLLVVIGFTGLILELKVPGLAVPGIIAALCFILVFWAHSRFSGEVFVLALLLFILGLGLIGLEIFVLPGFGAPGIIGILLMLGGLALVTFERVPQSGEEWIGLGLKASQYMLAGMGSFALAFLIARFLPRVPYANRMMLIPPEEAADRSDSALPGVSEAAGMLGAIGTASTPLRPAGVVRVADKFVDVVSDGGFIPAGARVQVIAVEGTRIVVKEV